MNNNLKRGLVAGAALLMLSSVGAGIGSNANASRNVGWRQMTRNTDLKLRRNSRVALRKNQRVYVIKFARDKKSAQIKIGRNKYTISARLLKAPKYRKAIKKYQQSNKKLAKRHAKKVNKRHAKRNRRVVNRVNRHRQRKVRRAKRSKRVNALKSRFTRSNNKRFLKRSGFVNLPDNGKDDIMSKYAPNERRAVIPKNVNINKLYLWLQGHMTNKRISVHSVYTYVPRDHGWVKLNK